MKQIEVYGKVIDDNTRCEHYHSPVDIIAIKFKCGNKYYACYQCHKEAAAHEAQTWSKDEWNTKAVLLACKTELTVHDYVRSGNHCPNCKEGFNPNCSKHYHLYFQLG